MSDFHQSRAPDNASRGAGDTGGSGRGLLWAVVAIAALGLLVLVGTLGGGSTSVEQQGDAGSASVTVPTDPETAPAHGGFEVVD